MKKIAAILYCLISLLSPAVFAADAPVTVAGTTINAIPGTSAVSIPVTVSGFNNIGQFTLTMKFDTTRVRYVSSASNPSLAGMTVTYSPPAGNTQGKLVFSWSGSSNESLADGSALANLVFSYSEGTGILSWAYTYGSVCQYKRFINGILTTLNDNPKYLFYKNGGISNRGAPLTWAPSIAVPASGQVPLPLTVNEFTSIGALTLYLEYDPGVITYQNSFTKNPAFGSSFQVGNNPGTEGKMVIVIQWFGNVVTLENGATLCTLNFTYTSSTSAGCALTWYDNGPSCEYADVSTVLIDMPTPDFYHDGFVAPPVVSDFIADNLVPLKNETVQFTDLSTGGASTWNWSFDRPGVTFLNGTTPTSQNPQVMFTEGGPYTVSLAAGNLYFTDNEIKTGYIRAGTPGLWTGDTSSEWNVMSNWDNYLPPDSLTDVIIPPYAPNWPVFEGDLIIGIHCKNLTLSPATSQMTITGNLTIP